MTGKILHTMGIWGIWQLQYLGWVWKKKKCFQWHEMPFYVYIYICVYWFQPMFYHLGIPRGTYRVVYIGLLQRCFQFISFYCLSVEYRSVFGWYFRSVYEFSSLGHPLEVLGRYVWGSLWCWRCLCGTAEPELGGEIWKLMGGLLTITAFLHKVVSRLYGLIRTVAIWGGHLVYFVKVWTDAAVIC